MKSRVHRSMEDTDARAGFDPGTFVDLCLEVANWRDGDDRASLEYATAALLYNSKEVARSYAPGGRTFAFLRANPGQSTRMESRGKELRNRVRRTLHAFLAGSVTHAKPWRAKRDAALQSVIVKATLMATEADVLHTECRYIPRDDDGVEGLLLAFLMDPSTPAGGRLRTCVLADCDRFFIARRSNSPGGRRRVYCTSKHQKDADRIRARVRVRKHRERKARLRGGRARVPEVRK